MERVAFIVLCLCSLSYCEDTYRAGVIQEKSRNIDYNKYLPLIYEAGKSNVDILVLPAAGQSASETNYDEIVNKLAKTAKQAGLYVVANLYENLRCQNQNELVRNNLVFDREGNIISVYRKPINNVANCTMSNPDIATFTTDFGVKFGLLMEEDLVLQNPEHIKGIKNFLVTGVCSSEIPLLNTNQVSSAWTFITKANLISHTGILSGKDVQKNEDAIIIADLNKNGVEGSTKPPVVDASELRSIPHEDLSLYIIRPLDLEASSRGYKQTVCHKKFCCEFYIKTSFAGTKALSHTYGLAAFDGTRYYGQNQNIGSQTCAVFTCAGLYKRSCDVKSSNNTNISFKEVTISANFTKHNSVQYPIIISTDNINSEQFNFETTFMSISRQASVKLYKSQFLTFGLFGRDFSKDYESQSFVNKTHSSDTDYIFNFINNEDFQGFIDYLWIRLRILIFVVSIYILEMM